METNSFKNTSDILKYIDYITDKLEVCLLGSGNVLEEVFLSLEDKFNKKTYIFKNHETYIITSEKAWFYGLLSTFVERFFLQNASHCVKV